MNYHRRWLLVMLWCAAFFIGYLNQYGMANPNGTVNWVIRINGHEQVSPVDSQAVQDKIASYADSLVASVETALDQFSGFGAWSNTGNSVFTFGTPTDINLSYELNHQLHLQSVFRQIDANIYFTASSPLQPQEDLVVHVTAPSVEVSGIFDPVTQTVSGLTVEAPGCAITLNGTPLPQFLIDTFLDVMEAILGNTLADAIAGMSGQEYFRALVAALNLPEIATSEITLALVLNHLAGALSADLNYEQPYAGALQQRDTPPVRGLMFSSTNIRFTKQSLGISGGNLTHYDNVYSDEEPFFQYFADLNIKFMRSEIPWSAVEPFLASAPASPGISSPMDPVDDYIAAHAQVFNNLEVHYQLAKQYLTDCLVAIGDGHAAPKDGQSQKKLWVGYGSVLSQEDYDLGFSDSAYVFITKTAYLDALELHTRALVRRLKHVINFWQIENELNQADLAAVTNLRDDFRRNGSAWAHLDFLDTIIQMMANSIRAEDPDARITHNFHPFRLHRIQDWGPYLDDIGLTYHPNSAFAFPLLSYAAGDIVKIAYHLLGNTAKPVWVSSSGYPAMTDGGSSGWNFGENFDENINGYNSARQESWVSTALESTGEAEAQAFFYRTYQALNPASPQSTIPNSHAGLIFPDGVPKASHDAIINALAITDLSVDVNGPQTLAPGEPGDFSADPGGGVVELINGVASYDLFTWERKELNGDWQVIASGAQAQTLSLSGNEDFWLRCTVTDFYGDAETSAAFSVDIAVLTGIDNPGSVIPEKMVLIGNYPNPFNPETVIRYGLSDRAQVVLQIFNSLGQSVRTLVNETQNAGYQAVRWDGKNNYGDPLPSGIYFYRLTAGGYLATKKMLLVR